MKYLELTNLEVKEYSIKLAEKINENYRAEAILFIAKGAYPIGKEISNFLNIPLYEVIIKRKGNKLKETLSILLKIIPKKIKIYLRKKEINSGLHLKNKERYLEAIDSEIFNYKKVVIVDDSIDTAETMLVAKKNLVDNKINVKIASLNVFDEALEKCDVDFYLLKNTMLNGPWSKDSKYYKEFLQEYKKWKKL